MRPTVAMNGYDILTRIDPYRLLTRRNQTAIFRTMRRREYSPGDLLLSEQTHARHVGLLISGRADVVIGIDTDSPKAIKSLSPGQYFGDLTCLSGGKSLVSVVCREAIVAYIQNCADFKRSLEGSADLRAFFLQSAFKKLWQHFEAVRDGIGGQTTGARPEIRMPRSISKAVHFIQGHFNHPLTVIQVADIAGMSKSTFSRRFKQSLGVSFKAYLNQLRVAKAKQLISHQGMNVTEACFAVGFNDTAYFSRIFRKIEGVNPASHKNGSY